MKKFILLPFLLFVGCSTVQPEPPTDKQNKGRQIIEDAIPYLKDATSLALNLALQYAEKDSEKRTELELQIHSVASNLNALLSKGNFNPKDVTSALKVKEEYINTVLQGISLVYNITYEKLKANDSTDLAIRILQAVAEGAKEATED